jgi:hypothetical protein
MNNIANVRLDINSDWDFLSENNYSNDYKNPSSFVLDVYGMEYIESGNFRVVDTEKFTIFMLKHGILIEKIVYENNCN